MTTNLDIMRRALRKVAGETGVPSGQEASDAMEVLRSLIVDLPGLYHNARWTDRIANTAYTAKEGERIGVIAPGSVTLPTSITWNGCARPPLDLARVQIVGDVANAGTWLYSATKATWNRIDDLKASDEFPFGPEDEEGFACQLAAALVDEYGGEVSARTVMVGNRSVASLRSRLKKCVPCQPRMRDYI